MKKLLSKISVRKTWMFCGFLSALVTCTVYYLSDDSKIQALACSGNYYLSNQEIYNLAGITKDSRMGFDPTIFMEKNLLNNPYIQTADVSLQGKTIQIDVQEKTIVGYYQEDNQNWFLFSDGSNLLVEDESSLKKSIYVPYLSRFDEKQRKALAKVIHDNPQYLNREILEKVSEMIHWEESYDSNMIKLVMQDGNSVFTTLDSLVMLSQYQKILPALQGQDSCLLLDAENSTINKVACDYMYMSSAQKDLARRKTPEQSENKEEKKESETENSESQTSTENEEKKKEETTTPEEVPEFDENGKRLRRVEVDDWIPSEYDWFEYSPSTGVYKNKYGTQQYVWNEEHLWFDELQ